MGVMKLADELNITKNEANDLMAKFFDTFPNIKIFMEKVQQYGIQNLVIQTAAPFKRKRHFEAPMDGRDTASIKRKSGNTIIQGTAADMVKLALVYVKQELDLNPKWDVQIKMQIHDEIICQARDDQKDAWALKQTEFMEKAAEVILKHKLLKAEAIIAKKWIK